MHQCLAPADPEDSEIKKQEYYCSENREEPLSRAEVASDGINKEEAEIQDGIQRPDVFAVLGQKPHEIPPYSTYHQRQLRPVPTAGPAIAQIISASGITTGSQRVPP